MNRRVLQWYCDVLRSTTTTQPDTFYVLYKQRHQIIIMANGDETYLEAIVEQVLSSFPYSLKRHMDLIQDLDQSCQEHATQMHELHQAYLNQAEAKVLQCPVVQDADGSLGISVAANDGSEAIIVPTTDEWMEYTFDEDKWRKIHQVQSECLQKAEEKVAVSQQAVDLIDSIIDRLDADIEAMEPILGGYYENSNLANELAACQVGTEWILAKVIEYDPKTGQYKLADEDVESQKGTLVGCMLLYSCCISLTRFAVFHLPETKVQLLRGVDRLTKGDIIYAVYPDTTSFYQASVVQGVRRQQNNPQQFVMVNFMDDSDEFGITHDKAVLMQHVMLPPAGMQMQ